MGGGGGGGLPRWGGGTMIYIYIYTIHAYKPSTALGNSQCKASQSYCIISWANCVRRKSPSGFPSGGPRGLPLQAALAGLRKCKRVPPFCQPPRGSSQDSNSGTKKSSPFFRPANGIRPLALSPLPELARISCKKETPSSTLGVYI